jgi:hypothetical protein
MSIPTSSIAASSFQLKQCLAFQQFPWQNGLALKSGSMARILDEWMNSQEVGEISSNINLNLLKVEDSFILLSDTNSSVDFGTSFRSS